MLQAIAGRLHSCFRVGVGDDSGCSPLRQAGMTLFWCVSIWTAAPDLYLRSGAADQDV